VRPLRRLRIGAAIVLEVGVNDSGLSSILTRKPIAESSCGSGIAAVLRDEKMCRRDVGEGMELDVRFRGKNPESSVLAWGAGVGTLASSFLFGPFLVCALIPI